MTAESSWRGHKIIRANGEWLYADTMTPTVGSTRPCGKCGREAGRDGHDPCLGNLPGVVSACCGHGNREESFVIFENGVELCGFTLRRRGMYENESKYPAGLSLGDKVVRKSDGLLLEVRGITANGDVHCRTTAFHDVVVDDLVKVKEPA